MQLPPNQSTKSFKQNLESHFSLNDERLLSRVDIQNIFGISQRFLEVAAVKGGGPAYHKIGRNVRYRVADLRHWIDAQRVNSTSEGAAQ